MANLLKVKRGLESNRTGTTPAQGELLYTTDEKKLYIGDGVTAGGNLITGAGGSTANAIIVVKGAVNLTVSGNQTIGTLPANADVIRTHLDIATPSDTATLVQVGDATNGAASYMASSENDPELTAVFVTENIVNNGAASRTIQANISNPGSTGNGTCLVECRIN